MTVSEDRRRHPMMAGNPYKIGVFSYLHDGGGAYTTVPERWTAAWDDIVELAHMSDRYRLDYMLPLARWKGVPGKLNNRLHCYETLTHAAALASITEHVALFATVHTTVVHPIFAAKAMVTIDHASHGRAGLNIVCGWNEDDFNMFGIEQLEHDARYDQGQEWFDLWSRIVSGADEFDFDGRYFHGTKIIGRPESVQRPAPCVLSAAFSAVGRDYAARTSDYLLTTVIDEDNAREQVRDINERVARAGRTEAFAGIISSAYVVCRETRKEAEDYHQYYAEEMADHEAVKRYIAAKTKNSAVAEEKLREHRIRWAAGNSAYPMVGSPEDVVEEMLKLRRAGVVGSTLKFVNFTDELPFFAERVLPLMEQAGLRVADTAPVAENVE